jgi:hypothetical protein
MAESSPILISLLRDYTETGGPSLFCASDKAIPQRTSDHWIGDRRVWVYAQGKTGR